MNVTPEEVEERKAAVQARWSPLERELRRTQMTLVQRNAARWTPPVIHSDMDVANEDPEWF